MSDSVDTAPDGDPTPKRQWGPRRRTSFALGIVVGLGLGIAGTVVVPDLFPEGAPDCVRPEQVVWSQVDGSVSLEVDYSGDGTDGCDASVVFQERPRQ